MDPLISIIMPVGPERDNIFLIALAGLKLQTVNLDLVEILLKIDRQDKESDEAVKQYLDQLPIRIVYMDGSRRGADLDKYANKLASEAKGKFIWYWTDEVRILTREWEQTFKGNEYLADRFAVIFCRRAHMIGDIYPCITRKWLNTTGRFAGHAAHDSWTHSIAAALPDLVEYVRFDNIEMKNSTFMKENPEYPHFVQQYDFSRDIVQAELKKDIEKIRAASQQK